MSDVAPRQIERTVLWNGGWDSYLIDLDETIDAPDTAVRPDWWKHHPDGTYHAPDGRRWILCRYLNYDWFNGKVLAMNPKRGSGMYPDTKGVRILKHLGGGD